MSIVETVESSVIAVDWKRGGVLEMRDAAGLASGGDGTCSASFINRHQDVD